jgi:5'-3' exonuclease
MVTSSGIPVTGTLGSLNALFAIMAKYEYSSVVPCAEGGNNWRKRESDTYKANRESAGSAHYADQDLLLWEVLPALGMNVVKVPNYEADDVLAHISRNSPAYEEIHILTCDRDLLSCVTNKVKVLLFNSSKKMELAGIDWVLEKEGIYPSEIKFKKSLCGDSSDNIAGIKGLGPKTAVKIIEECRPITEDSGEKPFFSTADRIVNHPKVRENAATFLGNLRIITLENDVPGVVWFASSPPQSETVQGILTALEFRSHLKPARFSKIKKALGVCN